MATTLLGPTNWSMTRDEQGHREYKITFKIKSADTDGPYNVLATSGLPTPGSHWDFDDDEDVWAFCRNDVDISPVDSSDEPKTLWLATFTFSTKQPDTGRCEDGDVEDPLLQPAQVEGSFIKYTTEASHDRFGVPITNSAWEQIRGPQVEFDSHRPAVKITQNVATFNQAAVLPDSMVNTVNESTLWGFPPRCVKLSSASWKKKFYGTCSVYYERSLEFDIDTNTFDREILDEGTKVLNGHWRGTDTTGTADDTADWILDPISGADPDPDNPLHFIRYKDRNGENARVILNGRGEPFTPEGEPAESWWVYEVGTGSPPDYDQVFGTFADAQAAASGADIYGPFSTQEEAEAATIFGELGDPVTVEPPATPGIIAVQYYGESDFTELGIPTSF